MHYWEFSCCGGGGQRLPLFTASKTTWASNVRRCRHNRCTFFLLLDKTADSDLRGSLQRPPPRFSRLCGDARRRCHEPRKEVDVKRFLGRTQSFGAAVTGEKIIIVNEGDKTPERSTVSCTVRQKESRVKEKKKQD